MSFEEFKTIVEASGLKPVKSTRNFKEIWEIHGGRTIQLLDPKRISAAPEVSRAIKAAKGERFVASR